MQTSDFQNMLSRSGQNRLPAGTNQGVSKRCTGSLFGAGEGSRVDQETPHNPAMHPRLGHSPKISTYAQRNHRPATTLQAIYSTQTLSGDEGWLLAVAGFDTFSYSFASIPTPSWSHRRPPGMSLFVADVSCITAFSFHSLISLLQARCRGYLIRRQLRIKSRAAITIQSHVRRMIAQRRYKKLRVRIVLIIDLLIVLIFSIRYYEQYEQRHRLEALRLRDQEERELKRAGNKRFREIADQHYKVGGCSSIQYS